MNRHVMLATALAATALTAVPAMAEFPERPITIVVPFSPGGGTDGLARLLADRMSTAIGESIVIDNRPGAGGTIGIAYTARQAPDGYTIVLVNALNHTAGVHFYDDLDYDAVESFSAVGSIGAIHYELIVNPDFGTDSYDAFVEKVKGAPGEFDYASAGVGSSPFLAMEMFKKLTGLDIQHIPYQGSGPALNDVVAGVVPIIFESSGPTELIKAGRLKALAITGADRSEALPDVPTFTEAGLSEFDVSGYWGFLAPAGLPNDVAQVLNAALQETVSDPAMTEQLLTRGIEPKVLSPKEFDALIASETEKWDALVKDLDIEQ